MNPSRALIALLTLASTGARADYVIVQKVEGGMQSGQMTLKIKDTNMRVDIAPQVSVITVGATGDNITLMHTQKQFMRVPAEQTKALMEQMQKSQAGGKPASTEPAKASATGRKERVENRDCEIYEWARSGTAVTYWITKDFPNHAKINAALAAAQSSGLGALARTVLPSATELPGMAVKTQMTVGTQKVITTIVSAKEETVDPALFTIPADYKELPGPAFNAPTPAAP